MLDNAALDQAVTDFENRDKIVLDKAALEQGVADAEGRGDNVQQGSTRAGKIELDPAALDQAINDFTSGDGYTPQGSGTADGGATDSAAQQPTQKPAESAPQAENKIRSAVNQAAQIRYTAREIEQIAATTDEGESAEDRVAMLAKNNPFSADLPQGAEFIRDPDELKQVVQAAVHVDEDKINNLVGGAVQTLNQIIGGVSEILNKVQAQELEQEDSDQGEESALRERFARLVDLDVELGNLKDEKKNLREKLIKGTATGVNRAGFNMLMATHSAGYDNKISKITDEIKREMRFLELYKEYGKASSDKSAASGIVTQTDSAGRLLLVNKNTGTADYVVDKKGNIINTGKTGSSSSSSNPSIVRTDDGVFSVPRGGGTATPVLDAAGKQLGAKGGRQETIKNIDRLAQSNTLRQWLKDNGIWVRDILSGAIRRKVTDELGRAAGLLGFGGGQDLIEDYINKIQEKVANGTATEEEMRDLNTIFDRIILLYQRSARQRKEQKG